MKTVVAGEFKDTCLKTLDDVVRTRIPVKITKRGRPVARLVPLVAVPKKHNLVGSILKETGNPFSAGEAWDADNS